MNTRLIDMLISLVITFIIGLILYFIHAYSSPGENMHRITSLLGGNFPSGFIQCICYFLFLFGLFEILRMRRNVNVEEEALRMNLLPEKEQYVISSDEVNALKIKMVDLSKSNSSQLIDLIKKACTKFRANKSVPETLVVVSSQSDINLRNSESEQSLVRYVAWAIPSLGFIGTVIGISSSLGVANNIVTQEGIDKVTSLLSIAFDTTLVALVLSLILMYFFHSLQEKTEKLYARMENYVLENLINRIYHR